MRNKATLTWWVCGFASLLPLSPALLLHFYEMDRQLNDRLKSSTIIPLNCVYFRWQIENLIIAQSAQDKHK